MDEHAVFTTAFERNLSDRLEKRQAFNIADGAPNFSDDNIGVSIIELQHNLFDFIRDMRNDLDSFPQKLSSSFLVDNRLIDLPSRVITLPSQVCCGETFVVSEVEISFAAVIENIDLAVLIRAHRSRINIDVGVEFLHLDSKTT